MADTRINALTTAATTTSDDFLPIDGTTNGSKKLSAFSPTFGGNATVTGNLAVGGNVTTTGTATITGGIVGPLTVTGGVIGANTATIALRPNGVTSTSNQVTLDTAGVVTASQVEINQTLGVYGGIYGYGGMTIEAGFDLYGGMTLQDSSLYAYGGITSEALVSGEYVGTNNYVRFSELSPAPSAVANFTLLYVDSTDGDLKVKFSNGVTKTLATNS